MIAGASGPMTWQDALDAVVARTPHERYRWLCSDENPDVRQRERYRALMVRIASGEPDPDPDPDPASAALQAYTQAHPCGNC